MSASSCDKFANAATSNLQAVIHPFSGRYRRLLRAVYSALCCPEFMSQMVNAKRNLRKPVYHC